MQTVGAGLGFTTGELDQLKDDNKLVQFLAEAAVTVESFRSAMTGFRRAVLTTPHGTPMPDYPAFSGIVLPAADTAYAAGIWDRLNKAIERIRAHTSYTAEIGGLLGVIPTTPEPTIPGEVKPTVQVFPAAYGMDASVVVSGREGADQWQVLVARVGTTDWSVLEVGTGKSVNIHFTTGPDESGPVQLQFRVQLRLNNANYGQVSDIVLATMNP